MPTAAHPIDVEDLMTQARAISGIQRRDEAAGEPLAVLVDSVNSESHLHERGSGGMRSKLVRILANRLRMQRDFAAHPEIAEQVVRAPIVIVGMPRTGSTKTQKLFASSGDFNWLAMWQTSYPSLLTGSPTESIQPRLDGALAYEAWLEESCPDMKYCHQFLAMEPEEDSWILEHSLVSPVFLGFTSVNGYVKWMVRQGVDAQFAHLKDTLKYLQWQGVADPAKRWILKCPMYYGAEPAVMRWFPDASLVMTHRTPLEAVASGSRMLELFHSCFTDDPPDIDAYYRGARSGLLRHIANRRADPAMPVLDIHYRDLITDPERVIEELYGFVDQPLPPESMSRMLDWNEVHPKDSRGKHVYSLEQYGFTRSQMESDFAEYLDFMDERCGRR
jgi:hypothetical protein